MEPRTKTNRTPGSGKGACIAGLAAALCVFSSNLVGFVRVKAAPAGCTPLVLDLYGKGIGTARKLVKFDLLADGTQQTMYDLAPGTALLVFDAARNGMPGADGRGLFGDRTDVGRTGLPGAFADGFEALDAFVREAERQRILPPGTRESGRLDDEALRRLEEVYGLGVRVGGLRARPISLARAGIAAIMLPPGPTLVTYDFDRRGNALLNRQGAVFARANGSLGYYADIVFRLGEEAPALAALPEREERDFRDAPSGRKRP